MDHEQAVGSQAAERYVLGELPAGEREAFEEHFFGCPVCADEVRLGAIFLANARALLAEQAQRQSAGLLERILGWRPLLPAALAACLALLVSSGYLGLVAIPSLKQQVASLTAPQPYEVFFLRPILRGDQQVVAISGTSPLVGLSVDVPPAGKSPSYRCDLLTETGTLIASILAPGPERPGAPLNLLLAASSLRPGRYRLILRAADGREGGGELSRFDFVVQFK